MAFSPATARIRARVRPSLLLLQRGLRRSVCSSTPPQQQQPNTSNRDRERDRDRWSRHRSQYNYDPFSLHPSEEHLTYPLVTASELARSSTRPRGVRMLLRDFIHDSLYNPHYGYFSRQAVLLPPSQGQGHAFDFGSMRNEAAFMRALEDRYDAFEKNVKPIVARMGVHDKERTERRERRLTRVLDSAPNPAANPAAAAAAAAAAAPKAALHSAEGLEAAQRWGRALVDKERVMDDEVQTMAARQVWHTPTQIFQPYYARAIARYIVAEYKLHLYPYEDLVLYELGAGSGALASDVLGYLAQEEPEIYARTRYRIVEISQRLADEQRARLRAHGAGGRVEVVHASILEWREHVPEPCFVVALEVLDNLTHDVVRFSTADDTPYQGLVSIDGTGDMHELYEPLSDAQVSRYLHLNPPGAHTRLPRWLRTALPFYPNLSARHYIPTGSLRLLDVLRTHFPRHRLVLADFDSLPDACDGTNAPVVQTRHRGAMVPVSTPLVLQGFFDIFFPTDFEALRNVYHRIMLGDPNRYFTPSHKANVRLYSHAEFLERYAELDAARLQDGSVPMLSWYANASWFLS